MKRALIIVAALAALVACSPDSGTVVSKQYREGYWYTTVVTYSCGQSICTRPEMRYMPECYEVTLDTGKRCFSRDEWEVTEIGTAWHEGDYESRLR